MRTLLLAALLLVCLPLRAGVLEQERERLLGGVAPRTEGLHVEVPGWVEDGAFVPLTLRLEGARSPVRLVLLRQAEPDPRIARLQLYFDASSLELSTRVRLPQSQAVEVIARDAEGRVWRAVRPVRVAGSSCLSPPDGNPLAGLGQARAWLRPQGEGLELVSLLRHPMESGRREDATGNLLPRRLLQHMTLSRGGEPLLDIEPFEGLAANPYWRLLLDKAPGALEIVWTDADGQRYHKTP